jgi:hypothetical protein
MILIILSAAILNEVLWMKNLPIEIKSYNLFLISCIP